MLRTLHRFRLVFLVILLLSSFALAFSGFAYSWITPNTERQAIMIDDSGVSFRDLENERKELDQIYRQQFGENYFRILEQLKVNLQEQATDRAIQSHLLTREADRIGFAASPQTVANQLASEFGSFPNPREQYSQFLMSIGMSSQEFEERIRQGLIRSQLEQIVRDSSLPSDREVRASIALEKTKYSVDYVMLRPEDHMDEVSAPSDASIQEYYEENASEFELPERVTYAFATLDPAKFLDIVEVFPDDVELYYTDHEQNFTTPERRTVRLIRVNEKEAASSKETAAKKTAAKPSENGGANEESAKSKPSDTLLKKLEGGADFAATAKSSSTHESAANGGLLGTLNQTELASKLGEPRAREIFALSKGKAAVLQTAETDSSDLILIEEIIPASLKSLEEVRTEIEAELRAREAPAFVAAKGEELLEEWKSADNSLAEFIASESLKGRELSVSTSASLADENASPEGYPGLTLKVLEGADGSRSLIDLGQHTLLVEVLERKTSEIASLDAVKSKIVEILKRRDSTSKARELAQLIVDEMSSGKHTLLSEAAQPSGQKLLTLTDLTREQSNAPFNDGDLERAVFSETKAPSKVSQVHVKDGAYYVVQVTAITPPTTEEVEKELVEQRDEEATAMSGIILASLLNDLKASSRIEFGPGVLGQN